MRGLLYIRFVLDIFFSYFINPKDSIFNNIYCSNGKMAITEYFRLSAICADSIHIYCGCFVHFFFGFLPCPLLFGTAQPPRPLLFLVPRPEPSNLGFPFAILFSFCLILLNVYEMLRVELENVCLIVFMIDTYFDKCTTGFM